MKDVPPYYMVTDTESGGYRMYIHVEAARHWQAFRDFLNGSPERWMEYAMNVFERGRSQGYYDSDNSF